MPSASAYAGAGRELASLAAEGQLRRGLRDVLAHHVIFAWNRIGLSYAAQSALAGTANAVVFGPEPGNRIEVVDYGGTTSDLSVLARYAAGPLSGTRRG